MASMHMHTYTLAMTITASVSTPEHFNQQQHTGPQFPKSSWLAAQWRI